MELRQQVSQRLSAYQEQTANDELDVNPIALTDFKREVYKNYQHAAHLEQLDAMLTQVALYAESGGREGIGHLIITMPPRHGKTVTVSRLFPTWFLGRNPDKRIILASYGASLAHKNSRYARNIILLDRYHPLFPIALAQGSKSAEAWDIEGREGGMDAMGVGGAVTGKGGHIIIVDDPVKSREEAESEVYREKTWDWFTDDIYSRREPGGAIIIVLCMTGDTPVLMANGNEKPLRDIKIGDIVATFDNGNLRTSPVLNHTSNGRDAVYKITMTSGKIVRANERHPFLVNEHGELKWIPLKNLSTGDKIVTVKANGENGKVKLAALKVAIYLSHVAGIALHITEKRKQWMGIERLRRIKKATAIGGSKTVMALHKMNIMLYMMLKTASALFAVNSLETMYAPIGAGNCVSTTTTTQIRLERCYATIATLLWGMPKQKLRHEQLQNTSDFTTDIIANIESDGIEEVFDMQVERTENFIANGLVSHNTRWHMDDLAGRLLKLQPEKWTVLNYPAIAEDNDGLGRMAGQALWPERYPIEILEDIKATMGEYSWAALYQQRPVPAEGGLFKRASLTPLRDNIPEIVRSVRYWDLAMSEKTHADYTAGVKIGQATDGHYYVLDVARKRIDWDNLTPYLAEIMLQDGADVMQGIEEKGYMSRAIRDLNMDARLHEYKIFGYPVDKDKVTRALPFAAKCGAGVVHVVNAHWSQEYVDELCSFPNGTHDDQVDASSGAWAMIGNADYTSELHYAEQYSITPSEF